MPSSDHIPRLPQPSDLTDEPTFRPPVQDRTAWLSAERHARDAKLAAVLRALLSKGYTLEAYPMPFDGGAVTGHRLTLTGAPITIDGAHARLVGELTGREDV